MTPKPQPKAYFAPFSDEAQRLRDEVKPSALIRYGMSLKYAWPAVEEDNLTCMSTKCDNPRVPGKPEPTIKVYTLGYISRRKLAKFDNLELPVATQILIQLCNHCLARITTPSKESLNSNTETAVSL